MFKGYKFYLASEKYHIEKIDLEMLVYASGGEVFNHVGKLSN